MAETGVAEALERWLGARGDARPVALTGRATVGLSQDTFYVRVGGEDGVLRLPTPASGPRAIRTQRAALQAVAGRVPAPALLWHDDGEDNPFGRPFLVMQRVDGAVPAMWRDVAEPERSALADAAVDTLAALHRVAPGELGGDADRRARPGWRSTRAGSSASRRCPRSCAARCGGSPATSPRRAAPVLVHGDFRMGNLMVGDGRLRAVLDWEMAGPGDALADLAWCFLPVWEPAGLDEPALVRRYADAAGAPVDAERLHWHRVLGYVRLAYYALSGSRAFARGHSDDLRLAALALQLPVHLDRLAATLAGEPVR